MTRHTTLTIAVVAVVTLALALPVASQPQQVLLRYGWTEGEYLRYDSATRGQGQVVINMSGFGDPQAGPMAMPMVMSVDAVYGQLVKEIDAEGNATLEIKWEPMYVSVDAAGQMMQGVVDLEKGTFTMNDQQHPLPGLAQTPGAAPPTIKMSPTGKVLAITGFDRLAPMLQSTGLGQMDPNRLMQLSSAHFPREPIAAGEQWQADIALPLPLTQQDQQEQQDQQQEPGREPLKMHTIYTLKGFATISGHPCAIIGSQTQLQLTNLQVPVPAAASGAVAGLMGITTNVKSLTINIAGDSYFDYQAGKLVKSAMKILMNMKMSMAMPALPDGQQFPPMEYEIKDFAMEVTMTLKE